MKNGFRSAYGKRERVSYETTGESLTQQHFKQELDIKNVIRKYDRTGLIQNVTKAVAQYGDFTHAVNEYSDALNLVINAQNNFLALPSEIREKFGNDPGQFLEAVQDPARKEEMQAMGLLEADPLPELEAIKKAAEPPAPPQAGE